MKILDLTYTYENGQLAGNPKRHPIVNLKRMGKIEETGFNTSSILLGTHTGTHMDAPSHLIVNGKTIDNMNAEVFIGDAIIVDFRHFDANGVVMLDDVTDLPIAERMVFVFGWDKYYGTPQYTESWPCFSKEAIEYLAINGMKLLATDTMSPDCKAKGSDDDFCIHKLLFNMNVTIVEVLANTSKIDFNNSYIFAALPLKLKDLDGSPCRALLIEK